MSNCYECKKKIGIFQSYRHPVIGGKNFVCGYCFTKLDESLEKWREFIISNSFNKYYTNNNFNNFNSNFTNFNNNIMEKFRNYLHAGKLL